MRWDISELLTQSSPDSYHGTGSSTTIHGKRFKQINLLPNLDRELPALGKHFRHSGQSALKALGIGGQYLLDGSPLFFCPCKLLVFFPVDLDPDPYPDCFQWGPSPNLVPDSQSGSGSRRAKMTNKHRKKLINFIVWSAGCSLLRAEGFFCSLDISILQFW